MPVVSFHLDVRVKIVVFECLPVTNLGLCRGLINCRHRGPRVAGSCATTMKSMSPCWFLFKGISSPPPPEDTFSGMWRRIICYKLLTFRTNVLYFPSVLKRKVAHSFETSINFCQTTWRHIPKVTFPVNCHFWSRRGSDLYSLSTALRNGTLYCHVYAVRL